MKKILLALILVPTLFYAQSLSNSPYSRFGYGETKFDNDVRISGMGGLSTVYSNPFGRSVNFSNPATNSNLAHTTFEAGANIDLSELKTKDFSAKNSTSYMSNLSLGFPVSKKITAAFGFQPYSAIGYALTSKGKIEVGQSNEKVNSTFDFTGDGGLNTANFSLSYKLFKEKDFSLGITGQYIFGNLNNHEIVRLEGIDLVSETVMRNNIKGFSAIFGGFYNHKIKRNRQLNFGATYSMGNRLKNDRRQTTLSYLEYSNGAPNPRTVDVVSVTNTKVDFKLPAKTSLAFGYEKPGRWMLGAQYDLTKNSSKIIPEQQSARFSNGQRIILGGYWIPKINSYKSYFETITYRAGLFYEKTGLSILGNDKAYHDINNLGITFGLGLPVGKYRNSILNISASLGQRGSASNGLLKINYANLKIGFNLSGFWFGKRVYK